MNGKVICFDFDDVINDYPGWEKEGFAEVRGTPTEGCKKALRQLRDNDNIILIFSARCQYDGGMDAIRKWLHENNIVVDGICPNKPNADLFVDDKGLTFKGNWAQLLNELSKFTHWKEK